MSFKLPRFTRGFTIIELLIVIVVIGILATLTVVAYGGITRNALDNTLRSDVDKVASEVTRYSTAHNGTLGASVQWYSGGAVNENIQFTPSNGNIIDIVSDEFSYCVRAYNPGSNFTTITNAIKKESSPGACDSLDPSSGASGVNNFVNITWTQRNTSGARAWKSIASSADGTKLAAVVASGFIYTSSDSGATWTQRGTSLTWTSIASSADGTKLAAASYGYIFTSTDSGVTWTQRATPQYWESVAMSADGTRMVAGTTSIHTSSDSGVTWTQTSAPHASNSYITIASSSDGARLVAGNNTSYIYTSSDYGATWIQRTSAGTSGWGVATSSSSGAKLAITRQGGTILSSSDYGVTWTNTATGSGYCNGLAGSSSGSRLIATANNNVNYILKSINGGTNWTQSTLPATTCYRALASSSDGSKVVAGANTGYIYTGVYGP